MLNTFDKACSIHCLEYFLGLPSLKFGFNFPISLPSPVLSTIKSRSNSAKALKIVNIKRPVGVLSMIPILRTCTFTFEANYFSITSRAPEVDLANRSNVDPLFL